MACAILVALLQQSRGSPWSCARFVACSEDQQASSKSMDLRTRQLYLTQSTMDKSQNETKHNKTADLAPTHRALASVVSHNPHRRQRANEKVNAERFDTCLSNSMSVSTACALAHAHACREHRRQPISAFQYHISPLCSAR